MFKLFVWEYNESGGIGVIICKQIRLIIIVSNLSKESKYILVLNRVSGTTFWDKAIN